MAPANRSSVVPLRKRNAGAAKSSSQTGGVFEGSVVVGGLEGASVGGAGVGVGDGSSTDGVAGLGADRGAFFRFTVFLLTSSLSSSRATFHLSTDYHILQIRL
jgi:hypothetical protein